MLWDRGHRSNDVIDNRGRPAMGGGGGAGGGIGVGLLMMVLRSRFGWFGVIVLLGGYFLLSNLNLGGPAQTGSAARVGAVEGAQHDPNDDQANFVGFVLDDVQSTWDRLSPIAGVPYQHAKLVLFTGAVDTACGTGDTATGPFYCPGDQRVYIDLAFYRSLKDRLGAPGDFAQAYVIAHEVGHHLQYLLGTSEKVQRAGRAVGADGASVRLELQADCYAGIWAHASKQRQILESGDIEEALTAAAAIGDDTLQRHATGRVRPETFSHGTSAQRVKWFNRGLASGDPAVCDTFAARDL